MKLILALLNLPPCLLQAASGNLLFKFGALDRLGGGVEAKASQHPDNESDR
jgi:hypothetical protein